MILLNFSHPLTPEQLAQIQSLISLDITDICEIDIHFDHQQSFAEQVVTLVNSINLSPTAWQTEPLLVNPPAHSLIAGILLAELNGRMGYFPAVVRLRPVAGSIPPRYEVAEIINLQTIRDQARQRRHT